MTPLATRLTTRLLVRPIWAALAAVLVVTGCVSTDQTPRRVQDAVSVAYAELSGPQIQELFAGNTVVFRRAGQGTFPFFHSDDGQRLADLPIGRYSGPWWIDGDLYCARSIQEDEERCNIVLRREGELLLCRESGACLTSAVIEAGDPYGLQ